MFEVPKDYKKWWCFYKNCKLHKVKMTCEEHLEHLINVHQMVPPKDLVIKNKKN